MFLSYFFNDHIRFFVTFYSIQDSEPNRPIHSDNQALLQNLFLVLSLRKSIHHESITLFQIPQTWVQALMIRRRKLHTTTILQLIKYALTMIITIKNKIHHSIISDAVFNSLERNQVFSPLPDINGGILTDKPSTLTFPIQKIVLRKISCENLRKTQ